MTMPESSFLAGTANRPLTTRHSSTTSKTCTQMPHDEDSTRRQLFTGSFFFGDGDNDSSSSQRSSMSFWGDDGVDPKTVSALMAAYNQRTGKLLPSTSRLSVDKSASERQMQRSSSSSSLPCYQPKQPLSQRRYSTVSCDSQRKKHRQKTTNKRSKSVPSEKRRKSKSSDSKKAASKQVEVPTKEKTLAGIVEGEESQNRLSSHQSLSTEGQKSAVSLKQSKRSGWKQFLDCCCGSLLLCRKKLQREIEQLNSEPPADFHKMALPQLCTRLQTDMTYGLTEAAVRVRIKSYGPNKMRPPPDLPEWLKFCRKLVDGFSILLWIGSLLCFLAYGIQIAKGDDVPNDNLYLGCVLAAVVLITAVFSYYQEAKSSKVMESFRKFMPTYTTVIRSGRPQVVRAEALVPGDIVQLKTGDKIPANCRIIQAINFKVDNSCVTGESEPQLRSPDCDNDNPLESKNVIFFSTSAVAGNATAVVVATGDNTLMGRMARLTTGIKRKKTPIARELDFFVYVICAIAAIIGFLFLFWFIVRNPERWIDAVVLFVGIVIGVYPGGVVIEVALCLTFAAKRMAKQKALVKNLEAVETLGSTSTICSDKTGTLTMNSMTVSHLWFSNETHIADTSKGQIVGRRYKVNGDLTGWTSLIRVAALCSRAFFKPNQIDVDVMQREGIGSGTEVGLLRFVGRSIAVSIDEFRERWPKVAEIPFSSTLKYQISVHRQWEDGRFLVVLKGAPENVFARCSTIYVNGNDVPISEDVIQNFHGVYKEFAEMGERVLGFAELLLPAETYHPEFQFQTGLQPNFPMTGLRFIGLISMVDPPRPAVPDAVRKCRDAGIRVVMVTGDHPVTAISIARMVGIIGRNSKTVDDIAKERSIEVSQVDPKAADAMVISGNELRDMTKEQLDEVISNYNEIVFARTSPQQKVLIVEGFQRAGDIVAVTGDGVNDCPALKQADIGIAMGMSGTDISKQAADMILLDDNFATIVFAIQDGRKMFDNLKKTVCYILGGNSTELAAPLAAVAFSIPPPMSAIAMLVLSLLTDMAPAIMLAYEEADPDIMKRKPRKSKTDLLVNRRLISVSMGMYGVIEVCAGFFAYFVVFAECGFLPQEIWGLRYTFGDPDCNNVVDSYGQEWSYAQRRQLQFTLYSVYLLAVVQMQWINVLVCSFELAPLLGRWWLIALPWGLVLVGVDQLRKYLIRSDGRPSSFGSSELLY